MVSVLHYEQAIQTTTFPAIFPPLGTDITLLIVDYT